MSISKPSRRSKLSAEPSQSKTTSLADFSLGDLSAFSLDDGEKSRADLLSQLSILGPAVIIPLELGTKELKRPKWQAILYPHTQEPAYQKELQAASARGGNFAVKLGPDSGRLFTLDIDDDTLMEQWKLAIPWLGKTLITRGARGCQFWLRLENDCEYPREGVFNVKGARGKLGELRLGGGGKGSYSVIAGAHPSPGARYHYLHYAEPLLISLADLDQLGYRPGAQSERAGSVFVPEPGNALERRIYAYLERCEPSIAGSRGDDALFEVALKLIVGWGLSPDEALPYMRWYNQHKAEPPWPEERLIYKLAQADKNSGARGALRQELSSSGSQSCAKAAAPPQAQVHNKTAEATPVSPEEKAFSELLGKYQSALRSFGAFRALDIAPRKCWCGKWLKEGDLGFIYGPRGAGKTWLSDLILAHLSKGKDIDEDWMVPNKLPVLLIDGEMACEDTRARLAGLGADNELLYILHHEVLFDSTGLTMNLANPALQRVITELCIAKGIKLLVLDTLSSLFRGMGEDKADEWEKVLPWLLDLRRRRIAVLIVHHAGRNGEHMRGTSRREDDAFWIIQVKELSDRPPDDRGARFSSQFTKWRNLDSPPLSRSWSIKTEADHSVSVAVDEVSFDEKVLDLICAGIKSATDIAAELSAAKSSVSRAAARLAEKQLIERKGNRTHICYEPRGFMRNST